MSKALSLDLREPVVAAVSSGMSRRRAAERFGVSAASAVRWCALDRDTGSAKDKPQGGDRHSHRVEAQADLTMLLVDEASDITWKKDRTCQRAGSAGHPKAVRGMVRRSVRSRSATPRLYRRDLGFDHGPSLRASAAWQTASSAFPIATGIRRSSSLTFA